MYGYVRPRKDQLNTTQEAAYKAAYCGLCATLGKIYGPVARFAVSYDMTFLYFLLSCGRREEPEARCFCPARPFCRQACLQENEILARVAAMDLILLGFQLQDHLRDESFFKSLPYRAAGWLLRPAFRKAAASLPEFYALTQTEMQTLWELEAARSDALDRTAHCFASILCACADGITEPSTRRAAEQILYHVGRFIYLTDCVDDLKEDADKQRYNPLRFRFAVENGALSEEDSTYVHTLIEHSVSLAGTAFELLPTGDGTSILENIIYLGLPAVLRSVFNGEFHRKKKMTLGAGKEKVSK